ncbi:MAG: SBBP repeat-containing protein [Acidobacteriaceae bacterium]|nr:SBBP repeat-containing protein [Acidobacteriaceae bacterium]
MQRQSIVRCVAPTIAGIILIGACANAKVNVPSNRAKKLDIRKLALSFQPNQGQTDSRVKFLSQGSGFSLFLTSSSAVLKLGREEPEVLQMEIVGGNPTNHSQGLEPLPGKSNYFIGNDPSHWRTNIPNYGRVQMSQIYPGVDLVYYGNESQLEYDWIVSPSADPGSIQMRFEGAKKLTVDAQGDLVVALGHQSVREKKPVVYQSVDGKRKEIGGRFLLQGNQVTFKVDHYDTTKALVIDPVLTYATYLGGVNDDEAFSIDTDDDGFVYIAGSTASPKFPDKHRAGAGHASWAVECVRGQDGHYRNLSLCDLSRRQ